MSAADLPVFLLGAGFSRAVSPRMPLTDELGDAVIRRLALTDDRRVPHTFEAGSFETWLTHLADEQPFLTSQENLENRALFLRISEAVASVLGDAVYDVLSGPCPTWLFHMIRAAHWRRSTVISFNYDTLIECAVATGLLYEWGWPKPVCWTELTQDVPNWPPGSTRWAADRADTLHLLKLHGSLNWYWTAGDVTGTSVARRALPGMFGAPADYTEDDRRRELPGRVPFVVPPSASKSSFYRNPFLRDVWRQAREALEGARHVVIIGYSLPLTDLTVVDMLRTSLTQSNSLITIVDPAAVQVAGRLFQLGISTERIRAVDGPEGPEGPIGPFVHDWIRALSTETFSRLRDACHGDDSMDPLLVVWQAGSAAPVVKVHVEPGRVVLTVEFPQQPGWAMGSRGRSNRDPLPVLRDVAEVIADAYEIHVELPDGSRQVAMAVAVGGAQSLWGYGRGRWHVLYTDAPKPSVAADSP